MTTRQLLLVDDNLDDLALIRRAVAKVEHPPVVLEANNGLDALEMLHGAGELPPLRPDLVLLDLKMPKVDGVEVLRRIREHRLTATLPVVLLSASDEPGDVKRAYAAGASAYLTKPVEYPALLGLMRATVDFWLVHNHPPVAPGQG